ncbi:hypothetical protein [Roseivirga pacifica]
MVAKAIKVVLIAVSLAVFVGCKSAQKFPVNENGVIMATQNSIPKSAVRLMGEIIDLKEQSEAKKFYLFRVTEVVAKGGTFGTVLPSKGEVVVLAVSDLTKFKNGDKLMVDAVTPLMKEGDLLSISML